MVQMRMARPEDFDACAALLPERWQKPRIKARLGFLTMSRSAIVAMDGDATVGFALMETDFFDENSLYVRTVVIESGRQREGIATELMRSAIAYGRGLGARRIFCDVIAEQERATQQGVEKLGFTLAGYIENMHDEGGRYNIYSLPVVA